MFPLLFSFPRTRMSECGWSSPWNQQSNLWKSPAGNTKQTWQTRGSSPQTAQAGLPHCSLINPSGVQQTKRTGSELRGKLCRFLAQFLKKAPWLSAAALPPCSPRGQLVHKWSSRSAWHRQSHPVGTWKSTCQKRERVRGLLGLLLCPEQPNQLASVPAHWNCNFCYCCQGKHAEERVNGYGKA